MSNFLSKEDYEEPQCLLQMKKSPETIPVRRVLDKLDTLLSKKDYTAAEEHLLYWQSEADRLGDQRGRLTILNELIGLYRKTDQKDKGLSAAADALKLAASLNMDNTVFLATTYINAATAYKAFGKAADALPLYRRAKEIYENRLSPDDPRLAGLYNNMAMTLLELCEYRETESLFRAALDILSKQPNAQADAAITYLNLADLVAAERGTEDGEAQIEEYLTEAERLLDTETLPHDGYYAFVCEKCAPVFGYYGFFLTALKYRKIAEEIYERS